MVILFQSIIWIVGISLAIYISVYQLFFLGGVDIVMSIIEMFHSGVTKELAMIAVWGFVKMWIACLVGWATIFATGAVSIVIGRF